jgi:hypothetical protein
MRSQRNTLTEAIFYHVVTPIHNFIVPRYLTALQLHLAGIADWLWKCDLEHLTISRITSPGWCFSIEPRASSSLLGPINVDCWDWNTRFYTVCPKLDILPALPALGITFGTVFYFPLVFSYLIFLFTLNTMVGESNITSNLHWISQMDVDVEPTAGRKSSIICTIGLSTVAGKNGA